MTTINKAEIKVLTALKTVDIDVNSIYDLVNSSEPYKTAIPVLIDLLKDGIADDKIKEGVIRALAVKEAKGKAGDIMVKTYHEIPKEKELLRWTVGNAMATIITSNDLSEVLKIIQDKQNGMSRQMFVMALNKLKKEKDKFEDVLISLLGDPTITLHLLDVLGKIKSKKAKQRTEALCDDSNPNIAKEAKRTLAKIVT